MTCYTNHKICYLTSIKASSQLQTIRNALKHIEDSTKSFGQKVVNFIECSSESQAKTYKNYIKVVKSDGCWSSVGRVKKEKFQYISLGFGCVTLGIVAHEFMHALGIMTINIYKNVSPIYTIYTLNLKGFFHEQSRPDRDNYVTVYYENIKPGIF